MTLRGVAWLVVGLVCFGSARAELPKEIRLVTYNIMHGEGMDGKIDLERIAKVIVAAKPDVVALQSVDDKTVLSGSVDQTAELERLTGMKGLFSRVVDQDGGGFGNAVLTKLPVRGQETVKLKTYRDFEPEKAEQRGVQIVELGGRNCSSCARTSTIGSNPSSGTNPR